MIQTGVWIEIESRDSFAVAKPRCKFCPSQPEDGVVPRARALLVGLEGMTGDIVGRLLEHEPGCEVIAERPERAGLLEAIRRHRPSIVVVGLKESDVGPGLDDLFVEHPEVQVLAVTPEGRRACLFREPLVEGLLAALQAPATRSRSSTDKAG